MNQLQQLNQIANRMRAWLVSVAGHPQLRISLLSVAFTLCCYWLVSWCSITHEALLGGKSFSTEEIQKLEFSFANNGLRDYEQHGSQFYIPIISRQKYYDALADAGDASAPKVRVPSTSKEDLPSANAPES
jgi:hypothetical protein